MKKAFVAASIFTLALGGSAGGVFAGASSVELGKKLFNDPALGGSINAKSCNSCHPKGAVLEKAGKDPRRLAKRIARCLVGALEGEKLGGHTVEMRSLKLYIETFARGSRGS